MNMVTQPIAGSAPGAQGASSRSVREREAARQMQEQLRAQGRHVTLESILAENYWGSAEVESGLLRKSASDAQLRTRLPWAVHGALGMHLLGLTRGILSVACANGWDDVDLAHLQRVALERGYDVSRVEVVLWPLSRLRAALATHMAVTPEVIQESIAKIQANPGDGQLVGDLLRQLMTEAMDLQATDLEFRFIPDSTWCWVYRRIQSDRQMVYLLPDRVMKQLIVRAKIEARVAEYSTRELMQNGMYALVYQGRPVEVRVETAPIEPGGEALAFRLQDKTRLLQLAELLRSAPDVLARIREVISAPAKTAAMILVVGATGHGKTTTLASITVEIDRTARNIVQIDNPLELWVPGVAHSQTSEALPGRTQRDHMDNGLRRDLDALVTQELRKSDAAETALHAANTGHLVLATVHAATAGSAPRRILEMVGDINADGHIATLASTLRVIIHNMLLDKVCPKCRRAARFADVQGQLRPELVEALGLAPDTPISLRQFTAGTAQPCAVCAGTGLAGKELAVEAVLFPTGQGAVAGIAEALRARDDEALIRVPGVRYIPRTETLARLIAEGVCDPILVDQQLRA